MMSTTIGAHNHHSSRTEESAIYLPPGVKTLPEIFKKHGYFTFNNGKDDYNFSYDRADLYSQEYLVHPLYGKKAENIDLADLRDAQPFFWTNPIGRWQGDLLCHFSRKKPDTGR